MGSLGAEIKGWAKSGKEPSAEISSDGTIGVAGMIWTPVLNSIEVKIGQIHFGSVIRGRLSAGTELFDGEFSTLQHMNDFVPEKLVNSKTARRLTEYVLISCQNCHFFAFHRRS